MIEGGYYLKARKIMQSDIMHKPPVVRELWDWLLMNANYADNGKIKRGQQIRTTKDLQEGLAWYVGYSKRSYSYKQIRSAYDFLMKENMIDVTKVTNGLLITICNYSHYQDPDNYEGISAGQVLDERRAKQKKRKEERKKENKDDIGQNNFALEAEKKDLVSEAVEVYNEMANQVGLPLCQKITKQRKSKISARLSDAGGIEGWKCAIDKITQNKFFLGNNDRGWRASIDFLCQEQSFTKLMEGFYDEQRVNTSAEQKMFTGFCQANN